MKARPDLCNVAAPTMPRVSSAEPAHALSELYPLMFDSIQEGVFTVDSTFRIPSFNAAAERITGTLRQAAVGRPCHEVFRASICQSECALKKTLRTGQPVRDARIEIRCADKRVLPIQVSTAVLRDRGKLVGGVEIFRDVSDVETLRRELSGKHIFADIIGASPPLQEIFRILPDVAGSDVPVLIEGPSGTGKELVARALHTLSPRHDRPFILVNCAALPDTLLESELFGHVRGAFTDARRDKPGRFALADKGTIFLDEIGDVSAAFQTKLLRVLQEGEVTPLGATRPIRVNVRVVTATNRDLKTMVANGTFREDLYYRIRVVPITLPPLRERRTDIPVLVEHFLRKLAAKTGKPIREVTPAAMEVLYDHEYPGNVRELENALQRAFVLCHESRIDIVHLPRDWVRRTGRHHPVSKAEASQLVRSTPSVRALLESANSVRSANETVTPTDGLVAALEANRWNRSATARALGIGRNTLWRRMKEYGLLD
jgi:PAS domain S-box-containing protein